MYNLIKNIKNRPDFIFFDVQTWSRLIGMLSLVFLGGCWFSLNEDKPECFPNEACPIGLKCEQGKCVNPPLRKVDVDLSCFVQEGCLASFNSFNMNDDLPQVCLILEQGSLLRSITLPLDQASFETYLPLFEGPLRSRVVVLDPDVSCPQSADEVIESNLNQNCTNEQGCIWLARALNQDISISQSQVSLEFSQNQQCVETTWTNEPPNEICDQKDNDCDGFFDEGVECEPL